MSTHCRGIALAACALSLIAAAGCSTKAADSSAGNIGAGGVKTDIGVSATTITLGTLTDLTGPFAAAGKSVTQAQQLYYDQVNAAGGVCGRAINVVVKDHQYNVQNAVTEYQQISGQVLAIPQLLGSPQTAALANTITTDKMVVIPSANVSSLLASTQVMLAATTYDYEQIDLIDYAIAHHLVQKGDKIGYIYLDNVGGQNAVRGAEYAAKQNNLTIVPEKIQATDVDMTSQVTDLKNQGVKAISFTSSPTAAASAAAVDAGIGLNVPILANDPSFVLGLLKTAAGPALQNLMYLAAATAPVTTTDADTAKFASAYQSKYPDSPPDASIVFGYGSAKAFVSVLQKACANKDLTRQGVTNAFHSLSNVQTGALPPLDYTKPGFPPSQQVHIFRPEPSVKGGLKEASNGLYQGPDATGYKPPAAQ